MKFVPLALVLCCVSMARGQSVPGYLPEVRFHLTARPWSPVDQPRAELMDRVDSIIHAEAKFQHYNADNAKDGMNGAIIDPYNKEEVQYSTAYFAFATAAALSQGRAADLIDPGTRAMDRATLEVATGTVPQKHGEFVGAPIMKALRLYEWMQAQGMYADEVTADRIALWRSRMTTPRTKFMNMGVLQNWRTYACKGEWLRQQDGLITDGVGWIEANWQTSSGGNQRARFRRDVDQYEMKPYFLIYHDDTGDPETFAYNAGAAGNLLDMLENGYDGISAAEMRQTVETNIHANLLYMGASGEAPAGGRSGDHTWNDVVNANDYEMMAEIALRDGDQRAAGQYRRASELALRSAWRFQQESGLFSVTKNQFDPSLRVHYANYSALTNYNGYVAIHTSEAFFARKADIPEAATPAEIGGYCVVLDPSFANSFINAGGMQMQICTHGTEDDKGSGVLWHTLGIPRFSRVGWDSRLGPADGFVKRDLSAGVSFCPTFLENGAWKNVCAMPGRYAGSFTPEFVHPLLVRGTLVLSPKPGQTGPTFTMKVTLTPDGALIDTAEVSGGNPFGVIWPLLQYDGKTRLVTSAAGQVASTAYPQGPVTLASGTGNVLQSQSTGKGSADIHDLRVFPTTALPAEMDQQNFIALNSNDHIDTSAPVVRGGYGDLRPVRVSGSGNETVPTFVYPRSVGDPTAQSVIASFKRSGDGDFSSVLGRVNGKLYVGRTSAGGQGAGIDLDGNGADDVTFSQPCKFILQLDHGKVTAVETDIPVTATVAGRKVDLQPFTPVQLKPGSP